MARMLYGATGGDAAVTPTGRLVPGATMTVWTAMTAGTQIVDLLDYNGAASTVAVADEQGLVRFYGPDGETDSLWVDGGTGSRLVMRPTILAAEIPDGSIQDEDINASAAIARTKIAGTALTAASMGVFNVLDYGAVGDGTTDDTAAIQAAIDAADTAGGGTVILPAGTFKVTGAGLDAKSASIIGTRAGATSWTAAVGSVLQGSAQTGPVLSLLNDGDPGGATYAFMGRRRFSDFTIAGDGSSDEHGLYIYNCHGITFENVVIRNTVGVPWFAQQSYVVTVTDCQIMEPVGVVANDTYYAQFVQCSSWRTRGLLLTAKNYATAATIGASGAVLITDDGSNYPKHNDWQFVTESLLPAEGCLGIVDHRGAESRIEVVAWDSEDFGAVTTPWALVKLGTGFQADSYGANTVTGNLLATQVSAPPVTCRGVVIEQDGNAVHAVAGYRSKSVWLKSGVEYCHIVLTGSIGGTDAGGHVIDDSGETTNYISDQRVVKFGQDQMGFYGADPVTKPEVTGSRGASGGAVSTLLSQMAALGLITDSSTVNNLLTANQASIETDTTGLSATQYCTIARSTDQAASGTASLEVTCDGMGTAIAGTPPNAAGAPVVPGETYTAVVYVRSATAARTCKAYIIWRNSGYDGVADAQGTAVTSSTSGWTRLEVTAIAPAGAAVAQVTAIVEGAAASEVHYLDKFGFWSGSGGTWTPPAIRPTVTGARDETEGALASLIRQLAALGLITDSTTAS